MQFRTIAFLLIAVVSMSAVAAGQQYPPSGNYPPPASGNVQQPGVQQPQQPGMQSMQQRPAQPPPLPPGFPLSQQEQAQVDQVLALWEKRNHEVKNFDCRFKRWIYDTVFGKPDEARFVEIGALKYSAPDKGMFRVDTAEINRQEVPIDPRRAEHWVSDGKSIIEFDHVKKQMIVHKLPPESQGKAISETPLPFLFGSEAKNLKERYFIHIVTPREVQGQIWLEVYPRTQHDAANFHHAQFIITAQGMMPYALKLIQPNEKDYVVYQFFQIVPNDPMPKIFSGDPFRPTTPFGWQKIVEEPQGAAQVRRPPNDGRR
jgi:TIGR03009 family protein